MNNIGLDTKTVQEYRLKIQSGGRNFIIEDTEENGDEYAHFFFIGKHNGKEVIYDAVLYTLRLKYESELHELAEEKLVKYYPNYKAEVGKAEESKMEEEMGLMMAEIMMEIDEEEQLKVSEDIYIDSDFEFGIGLEASLNRDQIAPEIIERFIFDFNNDQLKLDPVLYSFQLDDEE